MSRNLENIDSYKIVNAVLSNIHYLRLERVHLPVGGVTYGTKCNYTKDYTSELSDILLDFMEAYKQTKFTSKQRMAVKLVFEQDYTQKEAACEMGCSQQSINQHIRAVIRKIAENYERGEMENE